MDWFLYDNSLRHERVKLILVDWGKWLLNENNLEFVYYAYKQSS